MSDSYVVVSKVNASVTDYVQAVVYPDLESAQEAVTELASAKPWQTHEIVSKDNFSQEPTVPAATTPATAPVAQAAEPNPFPAASPVDPTIPVPTV